MKSIISLAIFCLVSVGTLQAQKMQSKSTQKTEQSLTIKTLATKLGLTVEQKANVAKTITAFKQTEDRIQASSLSASDKTAKIVSINKRKEANLKTFLTEDQYAKYQLLTKNQKNSNRF